MKDAGKSDTARRLGKVGSPTWRAMLDAGEEALMDGVGALTAARIAERLGIKRRLVFYYFQTLDDLIVEIFRRSSKRELSRIRKTVHAEKSLREIWAACVVAMHPRLVAEFIALANRIEKLRIEVVHFIEESRRLQIEALGAALARNPRLSSLDPAAIAIIATSTALTLVREKELGMADGHEDVEQLIEGFLSAAEVMQPASEFQES